MSRSSVSSLDSALQHPDLDLLQEPNQVFVIDESDITSYITMRFLQQVNVVSDRASNKAEATILLWDRLALMKAVRQNVPSKKVSMYRLVIIDCSR